MPGRNLQTSEMNISRLPQRMRFSRDLYINLGKHILTLMFPVRSTEKLVAGQVNTLLESPEKFTSLLAATPDTDVAAQKARHLATEWGQLGIGKQHEFIRKVTRRVTVGQTALWVEVDAARLFESLLERKPALSGVDEHESKTVTLSAEFTAVRRGSAVRLTGAGASEAAPISSLVKAVARAHCWYERIVAGEQVGDIARQTGLSTSYVNRILQSALVSPKFTTDIVMGKHGADLTLKKLTTTHIQCERASAKR
jgi:hypothetical protein